MVRKSDNEEVTKLHLITPALQKAGRNGPCIMMEYPIAAGQILLHNDGHKKLNPLKADYLLRYGASLPIAAVEARISPLQAEIDRLSRQFWASKDKVKANKYDLSASCYQGDTDETHHEQP